MSLYGEKDKETTPDEWLKVLRINAVGLFAEGYSDWFNSDNEFLEYLYGELGTDEAEIKELGVDLCDILQAEKTDERFVDMKQKKERNVND